MSKFFQFNTNKNWVAELSPDISIYDFDFIQLSVGECYTQIINGDFDLNNLVVVNCENKVQTDFVYTFQDLGDNNFAVDFHFNKDFYSEVLQFKIDDNYSNRFVVTDERKEQTSLIHYKNISVDCDCIEAEKFFQSIRLKLKFIDCEDEDEIEEYFEISSGNLTTSKYQERTFAIYKLIGDKLVNDCFKVASQSTFFYINNCRAVLKEAFARSRRIGRTNCSESEFALELRKEETLQPFCYQIPDGGESIGIYFDSGFTDVAPKIIDIEANETIQLFADVSDFDNFYFVCEWYYLDDSGNSVLFSNELNPIFAPTTAGNYTISKKIILSCAEFVTTTDLQVQATETIIPATAIIQSIYNGVLLVDRKTTPVNIGSEHIPPFPVSNTFSMRFVDCSEINSGVITSYSWTLFDDDTRGAVITSPNNTSSVLFVDFPIPPTIPDIWVYRIRLDITTNLGENIQAETIINITRDTIA